MKTLASLLLISATLAGTAAYAHEPSGELDYPPPISQTGSLTRDQAVAARRAAQAAGQVTFGEIEEAAPQGTASTLTRGQVHTDAVAAHANGSYAFGELDYPSSDSPADASRG
ncbi:hypothetical protein AKI39_05460 [Bordetella sp. H567]|uniref:DUF4148 domain-containing protein n=1 Tax=Bordetella sp. H567 TaxID=1697043 RepID=UPI00081C4647|nr:DUF4148 domain-containing protein [Bordetella sp. H567]AOB30255.1 hypothetical protein AKI39_05460 [Bordetella sp. H567]